MINVGNTSRHTILLVGVPIETEERIREFLPESQFFTVSLEDKVAPGLGSISLISPLPVDPKLILVYAQKEPTDTAAICRQLRGVRETASSPILLAVGRYQIGQGNDLRSLGDAAFVILPLSRSR